MGIAVFFSLSVLWFALAAWVYFDAAERDKPAILWAALILFSFFFLFIPIVLYPIFRDSGQRRFVPAGGGSRQYLYVAAFAGLTTPLTGLAIIVTFTFARAISHEQITIDDYKKALAAGLSAIIVGAAV